MARNVLRNPGFELGDTGWTKGTGWAISLNVPTARTGSWRAIFTGSAAADLESTVLQPVRPGMKVSASVWIDATAATAGTGHCMIEWLDVLGAIISTALSTGKTSGGYTQETLADQTVPEKAKNARIGVRISGTPTGTWRADDASASGDYIEDLPAVAKISGHRIIEARTVSRFQPLIGTALFQEFNAGKSDDWSGVYQIIPLLPGGNLEQVMGFQSRIGRLGLMFAFDPDRRIPLGGIVNGMLVDGASQVGEVLNVKSGPVDTIPLVAGDYVEVRDQYYQLKADLEIGPQGTGIMEIWPAIRTSPVDGEAVITDNPKMVARLTSDPEWASGHVKITEIAISWQENT